MSIRGIKPHTHAERAAVIEQLLPLWQQKFGENLLAIAACASYARGEDCAYSDLELEVFLKEMPPEGQDRCLQRVVDGMLIEAIYRTPEQYLAEHSAIAPHWHLSASDVLLPLYNASFIEALVQQVKAAEHTPEEFIRQAACQRYELQESFTKVLNAVEQNNVEGVSLLVFDAVLHLLHVLALLNRQPFRTFARYITQARSFEIKPARFDELLEMLVQGSYQDLPRLRQLALAIFESVERLFVERGLHLYDEPLDPGLPNPVL